MVKFTYGNSNIKVRHIGEPIERLNLKTTFRRNMRRLLRGFRKTPAVTEYQIKLLFIDAKTTCQQLNPDIPQEVTRDNFLAFLLNAAGHLITYTDPDNVAHKVRIIDYSQATFEGKNKYSLDITLEEAAS